ncbi:chromosome partitioning protein [Cellulomonas fimi]|uniref:Chromosome partitioning protein n=1 Tax=Cellulomonas fimi TaxID=1708 RepID=A0A7Y0M0W3_CELFI|nr:chromosome partitioning protein [Cellulomonas fimi]NMR21561.1 chromosome partitioning protein [Cellulomonas fimi]
MSEHLPDSFDPQQPDLPSMAVDPDPIPDTHEGQAPTTEGDDPAEGEGVPG